MSKQCSKCKEIKPFSEFSQSNPTKKDGHNSWCKQCCRDSSKRARETASGVYSASKGQWRHRERKPFTMEREEFVEWYENQEQICVYCGLTVEETHLVDDPILDVSDRLTIDCKDNYTGYTIDNIVLACRRCNNIKNDFFTYEEMLLIADLIVKPRWKDRLGKSKL